MKKIGTNFYLHSSFSATVAVFKTISSEYIFSNENRLYLIEKVHSYFNLKAIISSIQLPKQTL
jgi:hypothetical protein